MATHEITVTGPHPYPGGRNNWYYATCSCGTDKAPWWGPRPDSKRMMASANAHAEAKNTQEAQSGR